MDFKFYNICCLLIVLSFKLFAQDNLDYNVIQEPSQVYGHLNKKAYPGLKKQLFIKTFGDGYRSGDTIRIDYYNEMGDKVSSIGFDKNKRESLTTFETGKDGKFWNWRSERFSNNSVWLSRSEYLPSGKLSSFKNSVLNAKGDTISRSNVKFTYNEDGNLLDRSDYSEGILSIKQVYAYKGKDLVRAESKATVGGTLRYDYIYNAEHFPVELQEFLVRTNGIDLVKKSNYAYSAGKLIAKQYPEKMGDKSMVGVSYTYDAAGKLSTMKVTQDTLYRDVTFEYKDNKISLIIAKTNVGNKFNSELFIGIRSRPEAYPLIYSKEFIYDDHGIITKIKETYNGKLEMQLDYYNEYY